MIGSRRSALVVALCALTAAIPFRAPRAQNPETPRDRCTWEGWLPPAAARDRVRREANLTDTDIVRLQRASTGASKVEREKAIERLGAAQDQATIALLTNALDDKDPIIVDAAVRSLGRIGATSALHDIERLTVVNNSHVRQGAIWALGQLQERSALPTLLKASTDTSKHIRDEATWALGLLGDAGATRRLNELAVDNDWHVRFSAACALWLSGKTDERSLRTLTALKTDSVALVRNVATWVVGQLR